jgi:hypothetical protein
LVLASPAIAGCVANQPVKSKKLTQVEINNEMLSAVFVE